MEPLKLGRTLGIGMRVASNILRDRAGQLAQAKAPPSAADGPSGPAPPPQASQIPLDFGRRAAKAVRGAGEIPRQTRAAGRGAKKFGQAFWGPFSHAGTLLWLEITGLFFAFFGLFFFQSAYHVGEAWRHGAEHNHFFLYAALTLIFFWFSVSSFVRARRKSRKAR